MHDVDNRHRLLSGGCGEDGGVHADAAAHGRDDGPTGGGGAGDPAADQTANAAGRE